MRENSSSDMAQVIFSANVILPGSVAATLSGLGDGSHEFPDASRLEAG